MKNIFILFIFLTFFAFTTTVFAQEQTFSVTGKRAIQLYKDADILVTYNKDYARAVFTLRTLIKEKLRCITKRFYHSVRMIPRCTS